MSYNFPPDSLWANFWGSEENYFCPPSKKICVWGISRGKLIFVGPPEHRNLCLGELISVSPPNIEIGVRGDLKPILPLTILHKVLNLSMF